MSITKEIIEKAAVDAGITIDELTVSGFIALLREKRRKIMLERIDILTRYGAESTEDLEKKIKKR